MHEQADIIVVGGGASGFFCAVNAARLAPGKKVMLLEKSGKLLQKVRISGGGRCNLTHYGKDIQEMARCYPRGERFVKKAFHHFFVQDTIDWFEARGVQLKAEKDGRMFPLTDSSETVMNALLQEAGHLGVIIHHGFPANGLRMLSGGFEIKAAGGLTYSAPFVCLSTGGAPKAFQYAWIADATGHTIIDPVPSLFTFNLPGHPITKLMGISTEAIVRLPGTRFSSHGPLLVTHWGLSGPAVLKLSAVAATWLQQQHYRFPVLLSWLPANDEARLQMVFEDQRRNHGKALVSNANWHKLPSRLWQFLLDQSGITPQTTWAVLNAGQQRKLLQNLLHYPVTVNGKTTFKEEFVTAGGIDTAEVSPQTMESRKCPGLYLTGEMLNVDGITGGFNFQFAWTSGFLAAKSIAEKLNA